MRRALQVFGWAVAAVLVAPAAYLLAALALGLLPVNADWRPAMKGEGGVPVWLRTNGVHADLVLPAKWPGHGAHDFTRELPPSVVIDFSHEASVAPFAWIAFGWGDRDFYLNTPTWADFDLATGWRAITARGPSAMHVEYLRRPEDYDVRLLLLAADEYGRLVDYIRAGFRRDAKDAPIRIDHPGFFATDAFFEGTGSYSPLLTCNEWVRRALAQAGVRTATWAPFDRALLWQAQRTTQ